MTSLVLLLIKPNMLLSHTSVPFRDISRVLQSKCKIRFTKGNILMAGTGQGKTPLIVYSVILFISNKNNIRI